jgi:hypothetical protein
MYWAESAEEYDGEIHYVFLNGIEDRGRILARIPDMRFCVEYFGSVVTFELEGTDDNGCDMTLCCERLGADERVELVAGWVSWLMTMKAAVDHRVDLRNHDRDRTWAHRFADN